MGIQSDCAEGLRDASCNIRFLHGDKHLGLGAFLRSRLALLPLPAWPKYSTPCFRRRKRMKSAYRFTLALSVCLLLLVPVGAFGQTTGTVEGAVTDQSNAPLPGVTVTLTSPNLQGT